MPEEKEKIKGWAIMKDDKLLSLFPDSIPQGAKVYLIFPKRDKYTTVTKRNESGKIEKVEITLCQKKKTK